MKKRTRRKVYPLVNTISMAISGAAITPENILDQVRLAELSAIESIAKGHGTMDDLSTLRDMLNLSETMARAGVGREALEPCEAAQAELVSIIERRSHTGRIGVTDPGLEALRQAFQWSDSQRTSVTRSEYEKYITKTENILRTGKVRTIDINQ
jgi:hypothetical protein